MEIFQDLPDVDAVFVAVGGGGLVGGIATYLKAVKPTVKVSRRARCLCVALQLWTKCLRLVPSIF